MLDLAQLTSLLSSSILYEIVLIILTATILAFFVNLFKQPLIPAYIVAGILLGANGLGLLQNKEVLFAFSQIGVAFLLFVVGLEIDINKLKDVGLVAVVGGLVQIILTFILGFFISLALGFSNTSALYLGLIVAFSSTMLVVKFFSDKDELDTLHGRITLGILLLQDIVIILILAFLQTKSSINGIPLALLKGIALILIVFLAAKFIWPFILKSAAKSQELLLLCAISVCFLLFIVATALGFSIVVGAFLAGISLASLPYAYDIVGRISSLKDFFSIVFFVSLGAQLVFKNIQSIIIPLIALLLIVIIAKPLIVLIITSAFGYKKRTSFLTALSQAHISEFSFVLIAGSVLGSQVSNTILLLTTLMIAITFVTGSYLIKYDYFLYSKFSKMLSVFEKLSVKKEILEKIEKNNYDIILFGGHRTGRVIIEDLKRTNKKFLVIDYNPEIIKILMKRNIPCVYGDAMNNEILKEIKLENAKLIISTIPHREDNLFLINHIKMLKKDIKIIVTTSHMHEAFEFYKLGADYVILPHLLTGEKTVEILHKLLKGKKDIKKIKEEQLKEYDLLSGYQLTRK